jgi:chemotaxis protein CheY-P-specific phosphatase CheC
MNSQIITDKNLYLTKDQTDEIWELGNAGALKAAESLSTLLNKEISIRVPSILMVNLANLQEHIDDSLAATGRSMRWIRACSMRSAIS